MNERFPIPQTLPASSPPTRPLLFTLTPFLKHTSPPSNATPRHPSVPITPFLARSNTHTYCTFINHTRKSGLQKVRLMQFLRGYVGFWGGSEGKARERRECERRGGRRGRRKRGGLGKVRSSRARGRFFLRRSSGLLIWFAMEEVAWRCIVSERGLCVCVGASWDRVCGKRGECGI